MVGSLTYSNPFTEVFTALSSFNLVDKAWEQYVKRAIKTINKGTSEIRALNPDVAYMSPDEAREALNSLYFLLNILSSYKEKVVDITDDNIVNFKRAFLDFYDATEHFVILLEDKADVHFCYKASASSSLDWDNEADSHWDNY